MSIDLGGAIRRRKPERRLRQLANRSPEGLLAWSDIPGAGPTALLLDTTVYIDRAAGRLPVRLRALIDAALLFHSAVALGELAVGVANVRPGSSGWPRLRDHYTALFAAVPASRLLTPDAQTWTDAGLVAGTLARTQRLQPHQRTACLNDALIALSAAKAGVPVLTANRNDFDLIQQLAPEARFVHY